MFVTELKSQELMLLIVVKEVQFSNIEKRLVVPIKSKTSETELKFKLAHPLK